MKNFLAAILFLTAFHAEAYLTPAQPVIPEGVYVNNANKAFFVPRPSGLLVRLNDSATQTNAAGGFAGAGAGNAGFIGVDKLDGANLSTFSSLSFTALLNNDATANQFGQSAFNIIGNFNNGWYPLATDFMNLVYDGLPGSSYNFFPLTSTSQTFLILSTDRIFKVVNGTGSITQTGTVSIGSATVTALSNPNSLTPGMFMKQVPASISAAPDTGKAFANGTTIVSVNAGASTCVMSAVSANAGSISLIQYGGIAARNRAGTGAGTTVVTIGARTADAVTTTADLLVGMKVTGTTIPANSYIVSLVANTSITLNNSVAAGAVTLSFLASGLTGIPPNTDAVGVSMAKISSNNPNAVFGSTVSPYTTSSNAWTTVDGGFPRNILMNAVNLKVGGSGVSSTAPRAIIVKSISINGNTYRFGF